MITKIKKRELTVESIFKENAGQLYILIRQHGKIHIQAAIINLIIDLNKWFNVTEPLTLEQIAECAEFIIEDHCQFLTLEDIVLCFKNAKKKLYKKEDKNWARIQASDILDWVRIYGAEKETGIMKLRSQQKSDHLKVVPEEPKEGVKYVEPEKLKQLAKEIEAIGSAKTSRPVRKYNKSEEAQQKYNHAKTIFEEEEKKQGRTDGLITYGSHEVNLNQFIIKYYE